MFIPQSCHHQLGNVTFGDQEQRLKEEERWNEEQALGAEVRALQATGTCRVLGAEW